VSEVSKAPSGASIKGFNKDGEHQSTEERGLGGKNYMGVSQYKAKTTVRKLKKEQNEGGGENVHLFRAQLERWQCKPR